MLFFLAKTSIETREVAILTKAILLMSDIRIEPGSPDSCINFTSSTLMSHLLPVAEKNLGLSQRVKYCRSQFYFKRMCGILILYHI